VEIEYSKVGRALCVSLSLSRKEKGDHTGDWSAGGGSSGSSLLLASCSSEGMVLLDPSCGFV
jgi:hypothetical protein